MTRTGIFLCTCDQKMNKGVQVEGVADALSAIEQRGSEGKIMVYPSLPELGLVRLGELTDRFPTVAAKLDDGRWTKAAEEELLRVARGTGRPE